MRAADKPVLASSMKTKDNSGVQLSISDDTECHVIDGGMLGKWPNIWTDMRIILSSLWNQSSAILLKIVHCI